MSGNTGKMTSDAVRQRGPRIMQSNLFGELRQPLVVAYGLGVDSTAALILLARKNIRPDLILHAVTGGDQRATYAYVPIINAWLAAHDFPLVELVKYVPKNFKNWPPYYTLEQNCLTNGTLPSISFSFQFKSCSQKWKAAPQHNYIKNWAPALEYWAAGGQVRKIIGYDASPKDQKRVTYACNAEVEDEHYQYWYILQEEGWDRARCVAEIQAEGLPVPPKSSCYFCAAMQPEEVLALEPDYLRGIVRMEARARPRFKTVAMKGLWGRDTKKRPGSMTQFIRERGLLPAEEIDAIERDTPREIVDYQGAFRRGDPVEPFGKFIEQQLIQIQGAIQ
jgi:hypothetical protein